MASGGQMKMVAVGVMLAVLLMVVADAVPLPDQACAQTCVRSTGEVPGASDCICSKNCACAGKCILAGGTGDQVKACFIDCVLKNDCRCNDECYTNVPIILADGSK